MELFQAHNQWAKRPDDERFRTIRDLYTATKRYAEQAVEKAGVLVKSLRTQADEGDLILCGENNKARLTNWAFGQLAKFAGAPADYLAKLPATLAAQNVNHGLARRLEDAADKAVNLLVHANGSLLIRAFTSERYSRIWNWEVTERLLEMEARGWIPARPTMQRFVQSGQDAAGRDLLDSAALYASDHDMFAFIMHPDRVIAEPGNPTGLYRGLIAVNSEVGASKIRLLRFLYREMCGNHIIWGAEQVLEMSARHVGNVRDQFSLWDAEVKRYLDSSASDEEFKIAQAKTKRIAGTKEDVLDALFGLSRKLGGISKKALEAGYDIAETHAETDGDPKTYWGMAQGLTRYSQTIPFADQRTDIDTAAGRLINLAF